MAHVIKKFIIIAGIAVICNGYAAQEAENGKMSPQVSSSKMSPRKTHALFAQKRLNTRQDMLEALQGRDQSRLSTQIIDSVQNWYMDKSPNPAPLQESDFEQTKSRKLSLHEELLSIFERPEAFAQDAQDFAQESTRAFSELSE